MIEFHGITWLYEVDALLRSNQEWEFFLVFLPYHLNLFFFGFRVVGLLLVVVSHEHQKHDYSSSY